MLKELIKLANSLNNMGYAEANIVDDIIKTALEASNPSDMEANMESVSRKIKIFLESFKSFSRKYSEYIRKPWHKHERTHKMKNPYDELVESMQLGIKKEDINTIKESISVIITEIKINIKSPVTDKIMKEGYDVLKEIDKIEDSSMPPIN
jgi:hypothetical protein